MHWIRLLVTTWTFKKSTCLELDRMKPKWWVKQINEKDFNWFVYRAEEPDRYFHISLSMFVYKQIITGGKGRTIYFVRKASSTTAELSKRGAPSQGACPWSPLFPLFSPPHERNSSNLQHPYWLQNLRVQISINPWVALYQYILLLAGLVILYQVWTLQHR